MILLLYCIRVPLLRTRGLRERQPGSSAACTPDGLRAPACGRWRTDGPRSADILSVQSGLRTAGCRRMYRPALAAREDGSVPGTVTWRVNGQCKCNGSGSALRRDGEDSSSGEDATIPHRSVRSAPRTWCRPETAEDSNRNSWCPPTGIRPSYSSATPLNHAVSEMDSSRGSRLPLITLVELLPVPCWCCVAR